MAMFRDGHDDVADVSLKKVDDWNEKKKQKQIARLVFDWRMKFEPLFLVNFFRTQHIWYRLGAPLTLGVLEAK